MIKHERFDWILKLLAQEKKVDAATLSSKSGVSEATIRRDITELAQMGKLLKVHGGALSLDRNLPAETRKWLYKDEKYTIAQKALKLIENDMLVIMDGGSTNFYLASLIPSELSATFVTNSPTILKELGRLDKSRLIMLGGTYLPQQEVVTGVEAVESLSRMHADLYLMGVCSLHVDKGITTATQEEAHLKQMMISQTNKVVALADSQKLNLTDHYKVGDLSMIDTLITDLEEEDEHLLHFRERIGEVI